MVDKTFAEQITRQVITKPIPKIPKQPKTTAIAEQIPSQIQAPIVAKSMYYGHGMYERTPSESVFITLPQRLIQPQQEKVISYPITVEQPRIKLLSMEETKLKLKNIGISKVQPRVKEKTTTILKEELLPKTTTAIKEVQIIKEAQIEKFLQRQRVQPKPIKPIIPPPIIIKPTLAKRVLKITQEQPNIFEVFVTKAGKEISLGTKKTKPRYNNI